MTTTVESLTALESHWAVSAIGQTNLDLAARLAAGRLTRQAVEGQIRSSCNPRERHEGQDESEDEFLYRVAFAYELAALECLDSIVHPETSSENLRRQAVAAANKAFDYERILPIPRDPRRRILTVLRLSALAYCGDRWPDLRRWFGSRPESQDIPSAANALWDIKVLYRLFHCWIRLFRKKGWDDIDRVRETIVGLRDDQKTYEEQRFRVGSDAENRIVALRLMALYHWAKATEVLARYLLQGESRDPGVELDKHFEAAIKAATSATDPELEVLLRYLHASSRVMVRNSLWWSMRSVNSKVSEFVRSLARRTHQPMFELLPPQRAALQEHGLLDPAKTAIVVDLPTSGGKTLLAEFRILQALNLFRDTGGWIAYVAPTQALCSQITRRLRNDFGPIGIRVEQLTSAVEVDAFENDLLTAESDAFDILVATPEKLSLAIRNNRIERSLDLLVVDEAHNLEAESRGLRIELFLATVKRDCPRANFLLLMPFVDSTADVANWLADEPDAATAISLGTSAWQPNERIVGLYRSIADDSVRAGWHLEFETLTTTQRALKLSGTHRVGDVRPLPVPRGEVLSKGSQTGFGIQTAAMASALCDRGTSIAVANNIRSVWTMARLLQNSLPLLGGEDPDVRLVQNFLRTEIADDFELVSMLKHGVGVHHSGLSDEARALMEWLAESGKLKVLCATTTIAQGINFPVSSVFLASKNLPGQHRSVSMTPREFWNLAGRAGRVGHDSVGVVGLAEGTNRAETISFVKDATGALVSRLVTLLDDLAEVGKLANLSEVLWKDEWEDFRCYIAHYCSQAASLDALLADAEHLLRNTYGYTTLRADPNRSEHAAVLLESARSYAAECMKNPRLAQLADSTGFSPEGVSRAMKGLDRLESKLVRDDWEPTNMFGGKGRMADLFGVMLNVPQLKRQFADQPGGDAEPTELAVVARDWVNGEQLKEIAKKYFKKSDKTSDTQAITDACKTIYRSIANGATWGISAISAVAGVQHELGEQERRRLEALPAMVYHGVSSEEGVLMRMNSVPRSVAPQVGTMYQEAGGNGNGRYSIGHAREFLQGMDAGAWDRARPADAALSGTDYRRVWRVLAGEER